MLIALAIVLISRLLGGGPEEIFQVPKLEKEIKTHVEDKAREQQLLDLTKDAKKKIKAFNKFRGKKMKAMKKSNASRDIDQKMIEDLFMEYHAERLKVQSSLLTKRLKFQELMTSTEWNSVIEKAVFPSEKVQKKTAKIEVKQEEEIDKVFVKLKEAIEKNIVEKEDQENVLAQLDVFKKTIDDFISISQKMNYQDSELARNKEATAGELRAFYNRQNALRVKGALDYLNLRETAIENTSAKEWKDLVGEMKVFFN